MNRIRIGIVRWRHMSLHLDCKKYIEDVVVVMGHETCIHYMKMSESEKMCTYTKGNRVDTHHCTRDHRNSPNPGYKSWSRN